jgi:hypothetical protein
MLLPCSKSLYLNTYFKRLFPYSWPQIYCICTCLHLWCLDDPSTHKSTMRHFDPHYLSTQQTVCSDNSPCDILTPVRSVQVFFVHPSFEVDGLSHVTWHPPSSKCSVTSYPPFPETKFGQFVTWFLDPFLMSCWLFSEMWTFCHRIFSTHLWCPAGFSA